MEQKILIIEDDLFLRQLISKKIGQEGYDVVEAVDGEEGIKKVETENPDLILLDLILPGVDGFEVLSRVKKNLNTKHIPVIILSNLGQKEDVDRGLNLGAEDFLIKAHFTPTEIIIKIRNVLIAAKTKTKTKTKSDTA